MHDSSDKSARGETTGAISPYMDANLLKTIFSDALVLRQELLDRGKADFVCFHIYEGIADLLRKMLATLPEDIDSRLRFAAEGFRFLFDAHAVWLVALQRTGVPGSSHDRVTTDPAWDVSTLTIDERAYLSPLALGTSRLSLRERRSYEGLRLDILKNCLANRRRHAPRNSNLGAVDSILVVDVESECGDAWQLRVFMEYSVPRRATPRLCRLLCDALVPRVHGVSTTQQLRRLLGRIPLFPVSTVPEPVIVDDDYWPIDRNAFLREAKDATPDNFCDLYESRFLPIHNILSRLYRSMTGVLASYEGVSPSSSTLLFSYRAPAEKFICFFPTVQQARELVKTPSDVDAFLSFWRFEYPRSKAISGWVLATGCCDYTEDFDNDLRWTDWIANSKASDRQQILDQLERVRRFFGRQSFAYLIPIVVSRVGSCGFEPLLMASVTASRPLPLSLRWQLYELGSEMSSAVRMAFAAQQNLEVKIRYEAEASIARSLASALGHEVQQHLNVLRPKVASLETTLQRATIEKTHLASLLGYAQTFELCATQIALLADEVIAYSHLQQGRLNIDPERVSINEIVLELVDELRRVCKTQPTKITVSNRLDETLPTIPVYPLYLKMALRNIAMNSIDALRPRRTGQICFQTSLESDCIVLLVSDNGPGLTPEIAQKLRNGEYFTTKKHGGLGYRLIRLVCTAHNAHWDVQSVQNKETAISIRLPIT